MLLRLLSYVTGNLKNIVINTKIPWDPDSEQINVSTDSVAGVIKYDMLYVYFYNGENKAGAVIIHFKSTIKYSVGWCIMLASFPYELPTETLKTWTFTYNYAEKRLVYYCNGKLVENFVASNSRCLEGWIDYWGIKPTHILFGTADLASRGYSLSKGNFNGVIGLGSGLQLVGNWLGWAKIEPLRVDPRQLNPDI